VVRALNLVKIKVVWIGKTKNAAIQNLTAEYLKRLANYVRIEALAVASETALLKVVAKTKPPFALVLLDSGGKQLSSEEFAQVIDRYQNRGPQGMVFAVGPADGFTNDARRAASLILSLGKMTLPHELARVVLLEQLYRSFSILKGHPYHLGHSV
jgi:23S rRNA (pseudouridine1915-N3)-methyltransferase